MTESVTPQPLQEPVSVDDNAGALTVDGTVSVDINAGVNNIGDVDVLTIAAGDNNIGNVDIVTVPSPLSTTGGGTEAAAHRVTIASDSTGVLSVDDNGAALTVDWAGTAPPIGAGLEATALRVTLATDSTGLVSVDDNGSSLTVDNPTISVVGGGVEATAQRVTIASDSTGVLSIDDNNGSITVDGTATVTQGAAGTAWEIIGDVAADLAVPANPVIVGGRASTVQPTAVSADGDSVNLWATRRGAQVVTAAPHVGIFGSQPWNLVSETAQYTTTQTSAILVTGGASERIVVTYIQIQVGGTTAGTLQVYFGTGAYSRGTNFAIFDGEFAPSSTLKPGFTASGPFISATNSDDIRVTTSAAINPLTVTVWYYVVV